MQEGAQAQRQATEALQAVTTQTRTAREQRVWNLSFGVVGVMLGAALWYLLPSGAAAERQRLAGGVADRRRTVAGRADADAPR